MSVGNVDGKPRMFKRGGARRRANKVTILLSVREAASLEQATYAAWKADRPPNRFITIHWTRAGMSAEEGAACTREFVKYATDWLLRQGHKPVYVWVRENDYGDGSKGDHVHMLWHLPTGLSFHRLQLGWIRRITGRPYVAGTIKTRVVANHSEAARVSPEYYLANLLTVTEYTIKGAASSAPGPRRARVWGEGGKVIGQRSGMSREMSRIVRASVVAK